MIATLFLGFLGGLAGYAARHLFEVVSADTTDGLQVRQRAAKLLGISYDEIDANEAAEWLQPRLGLDTSKWAEKRGLPADEAGRCTRCKGRVTPPFLGAVCICGLR